MAKERTLTEFERKQIYLEEAITTRTASWREPLRLYCNVALSDLGSEKEGLVDFVICKGEEILLAVEITDPEGGDEGKDLRGIPVLKVPIQQAGNRTLEFLDSYIKKALREKEKERSRYAPQPVSEELQEKMLRERMLEQPQNNVCLPTQYGSSSGVVRGYVGMMQKLFCTEQAKEKIMDIWEWKNQPEGRRRNRRIPFAKRLEQLGTLKLSGNEDSIHHLRDFAALPVDDYMKDCPNELAKLKKCLHISERPGQKITCLQVVRAADRCLHSEQEETGRRIMQLFAAPLVHEYERRKNRYDDDESFV